MLERHNVDGLNSKNLNIIRINIISNEVKIKLCFNGSTWSINSNKY